MVTATPEITLLRDTRHGGAADQPQAVAGQLVEFVRAARSSIHVAIYDFRLVDGLGDELVATLKDLARRGLDVRIAYDHGKPRTPSADPFAAVGGDPAPKGTHEWLAEQFGDSAVRTRPVRAAGIPDAEAQSEVQTEPIAGTRLMHNKYVIRDGAAVWTGSTNFTNDAWTFQENNVVVVASEALARPYETDFEELWKTGDIRSTGVGDEGSVDDGEGVVDYAFAPGEGRTIDERLASLVASAGRRIRIASMVITSHAVLDALSEAIGGGRVDLAGVYDHTQMEGIVRRWRKTASGSESADTFESVARHLAGKASAPYRPDGRHDFMHDKLLVCDDQVATGSFNFSSSATKNSENSLVFHDPALADRYATYVDELVRTYGA
jgi:phosphatidylserine/phosphatidylglycerophosphate/cardiolipin synthase-like enzyme